MAKILVVDDEELMLRLLDQILSKDGYICSLAGNGLEARKCLGEQSFDLAICYVNMRGESGIDLKKGKICPHLK